MNRESNAVALRDSRAPVSAPASPTMPSVEEIRGRVQIIQKVMAQVMKPDVHYGKPPGIPKPFLYKAGAEKLAMTFHISVETEVVSEVVTDDEIFYRVRATARQNGGVVGSAEASCSTREKKYRWRAPVHEKEFLAMEEHHRRVTFTDKGQERHQVRTDPGELLNTILQMAAKRAYVAVIRSVTAASDIFAQELDDDDANGGPRAPAKDRAPAGESAPGEADLRVVGVRSLKSGEKDGRPWTLWAVKFSNGNEATHFSDDWAKLAEQAQATGALVTARVSEGKKPGEYKLDAFELVPA